MNKFSKITIRLVAVAQILAISLLAACSPITMDTSTSLTACHSTGDPANPYEELTVTSAELVVHQGHPNDIIPVLTGGCPTNPVVVNDGKITICHATGSETNPYNEITVSINGLNGHGAHAGDVFLASEGGCPATAEASSDGKITICHATGSSKNPYNEITISEDGLNGHDKHSDDIIPAPAGGCPE